MKTVVLITGAGSGIGRATARAFAQQGASLVLCDVHADNLAAIAREVGAIHNQVVDVSDREAMRTFAADVHAKVGAVDVLVNNAGVGCQGGILDTTLDDWDWVIDVNLKGVVHGCHFFVPPMVARGSGHVVNVSSVYGIAAGSMVTAYCASKFGVFGLSESMRAELAPKGIGVTTICPGMINTNIINTSRFVQTEADQQKQRFASKLFATRGTPPEAVAAAILDGVKKKRDVVPVTAAAWALYGLKRFAPRLTAKIIALGEKRAHALAAKGDAR